MKTLLVITDLTRMQHGNVCIAGYDSQRNCIRPVNYPHGISEVSIIEYHKAVAFPFAVVECDLLQPAPDPPHTEDYQFIPESIHWIRTVDEEQKRANILSWSLYQTVADLFGQPILHEHGCHVMQGQGVRSLGTLIPHAISKVAYQAGAEGTWGYRILFKDGAAWYNLKITDLTFNYYCDFLRGKGCESDQIALELTRMLKSRKVYLRIGLSRGWKKYPGCCFLQINSILTFPDYLQGKTFVDLL
jgi:hypothetical protein